MSEFVEIHGENWKVSDIKDNVEWAKEQEWTFKKYEDLNNHEHCLVCFWTIFVSDNENESCGYFYGGSTWLCQECYTKFVHET